MTPDLCGSRTSLETPEAAVAWDALQRRFLAHGADAAQHLGRVLELEPGFAMGQAVRGLFMLMLGRRELVPVAREALAQARAGAAPTPREGAYVTALAAWLEGRPSGAIAAMEEVLRDDPQDALAIKIGHSVRFILGDGAGMRASLEATLPRIAADHPLRGYILGCHAFSLEETGDYAAAEAAGHAGLALAPDDAWGLHAVAHVHDMTGRAGDGLRWLSGREAAWMHCNNFRYHVWWHKALMHLDMGQTAEALALYDTAIRADRTDDYRDISDAASLLCRLDLDGVATGDRWQELAALSEARTEDGCLIFADLHYLLALVGGERQEAAASLVARIRRDAANCDNEAAQRMSEPGVATAIGLEAFGNGQYAAAFRALRAARPTMQRAGGSHAQRDVFDRLTIDSGIRAGYVREAAVLLEDRRQRRGGHEDGYCAARMAMIAAMEAGAPRRAAV